MNECYDPQAQEDHGETSMPASRRQKLIAKPHYSHFSSIATTIALLTLMTANFTSAMAEDPEFLLKPLVDTSNQSTKPSPSTQNQSEPSSSNTNKTGDVPVSWHNTIPTAKGAPPLSTQAPIVLNGKIESLQSAIDIERDKVDWYAWYLSVRKYLARTGGLPCMLGTPIRFYRNGRIEALTPDPSCQASLAHRRFPLPAETQLDAIILPVRKGTLPPVSPNELYSRIKD